MKEGFAKENGEVVFRRSLNLNLNLGEKLLACWRVGVLAHWRIGVLVCWCVGALVCWGVGVLVCWRVGELGSREGWGRACQVFSKSVSTCRYPIVQPTVISTDALPRRGALCGAGYFLPQ
jgi:hypothetical protein